MLAGVACVALVPQVVDAVDPVPVLAAGGVASASSRGSVRDRIIEALFANRAQELTPLAALVS
jgi:hypothetical protein